jgi:hypothetical protein
MTAHDVYSYMIDDDYIERKYPVIASKVYNDLDDAFSEMEKSNDGIFSYKYLQRTAYREVIIQSMRINNYPNCELNYANKINGIPSVKIKYY